MICSGKRSSGSSCGEIVYKCKNCGATGCENEECSWQNFQSGKCKRCGNYLKTPA